MAAIPVARPRGRWTALVLAGLIAGCGALPAPEVGGFNIRRKIRDLVSGSRQELCHTVSEIEIDGARVLPREVVARATVQSGLVGRDLRTKDGQSAINHCVALLNDWYAREGYLFAHISDDVTLISDGRLRLTAEEPLVQRDPVRLRFLKVKPTSAVAIGTANHSADGSADGGAWEEVRGRTRPRVLATALRLVPGEPFRWDNGRWQALERSGLFVNASAKALPTSDGRIAVQVTAAEAPFTSIEPALRVGGSQNEIAGELILHERNLAGRNVKVDATVGSSLEPLRSLSRSPDEPISKLEQQGALTESRGPLGAPSLTLRMTDDKFGLPGAWQLALQQQHQQRSSTFSLRRPLQAWRGFGSGLASAGLEADFEPTASVFRLKGTSARGRGMEPRRFEAWSTLGFRFSNDADGGGLTGPYVKGGVAHQVVGQRFLGSWLRDRRCVTSLRSHIAAGVGETLSVRTEALDCTGLRRVRGFKVTQRYSRFLTGLSAEVRFPISTTATGAMFADAVVGRGIIADQMSYDQAASAGLSFSVSLLKADISFNSQKEWHFSVGLRED